MKKLFFILIAFLMSISPSYASTWVQVDDYEYIDMDSIEYYTNNYGQVQFDKKIYWMKTINHDDLYKEEEKILKKKISYSNNQWIIDTTKKSYAIKSGIYYDENGNAISSYTFNDYRLNWNPVVPDSKGEFWFELIKKPRYLKRMYKEQLLQQNQ